MLSFLSNYTSSFLLALMLWPLAAFVLTLPILVVQYRRYNKLRPLWALYVYLFIFYLLGLVCFTLYPLPEDTVTFCRDHHLSPQLNVFRFIFDVRTDGFRAITQLVMNFAFFVPLGAFLKFLFGVRIRTVLFASLAVSLLVETAQLTGIFGMYPCVYRLFDIDDLIINTLGGLSGYVLVSLLPKREFTPSAKNTVVHRAGLIRYAVAFILDALSMITASLFTLVALYLFIGGEKTMEARDIVPVLATIILFGAMPYLLRGWSFGGALVRLNHDDKKRSAQQRSVFYAARTVYIAAILLPPHGWHWLVWLVLAATVVLWWKYKKLPYQFL